MSGKSATLYRMVRPDHSGPFGVRAKSLLEEHSFPIDGKVLGPRQEVDDLEAEHGVDTTLQVFIAGQRIGDFGALKQYLAG